MANQLSITNVITVSVAQAPAGLVPYNTSNLALFTREEYDPETFGDAGYKVYTSPSDVATDFGTDSVTYKMALAVFSQQPNILAGGGKLVIIPFLSSEELAVDAINRTKDLVQYFGVMQAEIDSQTYTLQAAAVIQTLNKIYFQVFRDPIEIAPDTGTIALIAAAGYTHTRGLYYEADNDTDALLMQAAYAGRALSVDFNASLTTITMNLKSLIGIEPDPGINQTRQDQATDCGADTYPSIEGVAKVLCSGANKFFDQVYNEQWFVGALRVAGFNILAQTSTKLPQTESGMTSFKGAFRKVCEQAVRNGYLAPGSWTLPDTFGVQADFYSNIENVGYYIYSSPISQQLPAVRETRVAPTVQIAAKEAGAIHKGNVLVTINA